jgi:hypothetical protein
VVLREPAENAVAGLAVSVPNGLAPGGEAGRSPVLAPLLGDMALPKTDLPPLLTGLVPDPDP